MKLQTLGLLALSATPTLSAVLSSGGANRQHVIGGGDSSHTGGDDGELADDHRFACDLPPPVAPPADDGLASADDLFRGHEALMLQVHRHAAVVRVPSASYDDNDDDIDKDRRWDVFYDLHRVLEEQYPAVHKRMTRTKVNTLGLVFTLRGTDANLKPLMLTAHQDVVPVPDPSAWIYPPFSGHFDGAWLWGRGSVDCKNSLTALLSAMEALLDNSTWAPRRSIVLAFGFDEESSGHRGAGSIGPHLEKTFGRDSMVMIVDEGGLGLDLVTGGGSHDSALYALPAVMEKGHVDVLYELHVRGGHSSTPLPHTGIGIAAEIITALEAHPYSPKLEDDSPLHRHLVCLARYSPDQDHRVTKLVRQGNLDALAKLLSSYDPSLNFRMQTSQSIDTISGVSNSQRNKHSDTVIHTQLITPLPSHLLGRQNKCHAREDRNRCQLPRRAPELH